MYQKNIFDVEEQIVHVDLGRQQLEGELIIPVKAEGIVVFVHGSGHSRYSTRNRYLAHIFRQAGLATLLIDLLTKEEEIIDQRTKHFYGNVAHFSSRLITVTDWLKVNPFTRNLQIGYFGDRSSGVTALIAASAQKSAVKAVVTRGVKTDLVGINIASLLAPTLLIVDGHDLQAISANKYIFAQIPTEQKQLEIIGDGNQSWDETSMLREIGRLASGWFQQYLTSTTNDDFHLYTMSLF